MNAEKFAQILREKGIKKSYIADKLGVTNGTLTAKISGKSDFTVSEMNTVSELLGLTNAEKIAIFFG